ncbi:MAG: Tol-Pal system beta propeller repeat protein TolB [Endomicrobium sp.]|jgi:TolB protein|nr:Tol-Pal system beta propeller repeat protein TolB [Endomicrobium sp.]
MKKIFFFVFTVVFFILSCHAQDEIYLSLSVAVKRSDIAVENFRAVDKNANTVKVAELLKEIIESDLVFSRHFNVIHGSQKDLSLAFKEKLLIFEKKGASVLLTGSVSSEGDNFVLEVEMLDVVTGETIWKHKYKSESASCRYIAHEISDEIVRRFTGENGIARSKIVFVNDSTRFKELYIIDYDGYNLRRLTRDCRINILPRWSPDGEQIIYTSYLYNNPDLFSLNIVKNRKSIVSKYQGLNVTGIYAPDGKKILLTLSRGRYPKLYLINSVGEILKKMTDGSYIDTSPSFAPNGQEIVFVSDRLGYPQLYIMNIDGGNVRRLTTSGFCDSPAWSPRGDKIVFTMRQARGNYDLYVYDLPTAKITKLTNNQKNNENPTWSPDGRFVAFYSNRSGKGEIYITAIDGSGTRKLVEMPGASYTPAWSPVLTR